LTYGSVRYRDSPGIFCGAGVTSDCALGLSFAARKVVRPDSDLYASGEPNHPQAAKRNVAVSVAARKIPFTWVGFLGTDGAR
jgi:hypothetical protein